MAEKILDKLVGEYYASRPNLERNNRPLCIFFFACSGSGKSTTRQLLVEKLKATYVCNDEVRELLEKYPEALKLGIELKAIVAKVVEKIFTEAPNKLVVFDNNIIQYYMHSDSYINVAKANGRPVFIIGLDATKEVLVERIQSRGVNVTQLLSELPGQLHDYEKATKDIKPDWSLKPSDDIRDLITRIRRAI